MCLLRQVDSTCCQANLMPRGINGIVNIDKPAGMTSHDVVAVVRRISGESRVGHAGTLDPMATGVLLICMGQATRVVEYLTDHDKKYRARITLGVETDTFDATGQVIAEAPVNVMQDQIQAALDSMVGPLSQRPPAFSAIKVEGARLPEMVLAMSGVEAAPKN